MCIGESIEKIDGLAITTGEAVYTDDYQIDGELYVHIVRSPHAFAKILSIDSSKLRGMHGIPGIELVLTWEDVPDVRFTVAGQSYPEPSPYDRKILDQIVRYVGDPVAIIAATDKETAIDAERKLKIEYELMAPVLDPREALTHNSIIHPEDDLLTHFDFGTDQKINVAGTYATGFGDIEEAYESSFIKLERTYSSQAQAHAMMETYRSRAYLDDDSRLTLVTSTQIPFHVRRIAAQALEMKEENVRVLKPRIGGGFGGKQSIVTELFAGIVTLRTGKPCKVVYNRKESFTCSSSRHMMEFKVKLGASADGIIEAIDLDCLSDTGAYGEHCWT
ncbi:MAG: molybdopterin cofactor-binding domain-containing protein, partial [Acidaminobacteraceae bacterium]